MFANRRLNQPRNDKLNLAQMGNLGRSHPFFRCVMNHPKRSLPRFLLLGQFLDMQQVSVTTSKRKTCGCRTGVGFRGPKTMEYDPSTYGSLSTWPQVLQIMGKFPWTSSADGHILQIRTVHFMRILWVKPQPDDVEIMCA